MKLLIAFCCIIAAAICNQQDNPGFIYMGTIHSKTAGGPQGRSSGPTEDSLDMKYYVSPEKAGWEEALDQCPKRTKGQGFLAEIYNESEDAEIHELVRTLQPRIRERVWIGGVADSNGELKWAPSGRKMSYTNFGVDPKGKSFISFISLSNNNYEWSPRKNEHELYRYICKVDPNQYQNHDNTAAPAEEDTNKDGVELFTPEDEALIMGKWGTMDKCPKDEFVISAMIEVEMMPHLDPNDYSGLTKISLGCTNGQQITSGFHSHGQETNRVDCGGNFVAYRLRVQSRATGESSGDQRGVTNINFLCKEGKSERELAMKLDCGDSDFSESMKYHCLIEQDMGEWTEWIKCPEGQAIQGIKTRVGEEDKGMDDAAIADVAVWCAPIQ